jgi:hypothetical protein
MNGTDGLTFAAAEPITAVDKNGKQITDTEEFKVLVMIFRVTYHFMKSFSIVSVIELNYYTTKLKSLSC